ncbi:hypothetical protein FQN60_007944 [Etheostoma spectabile]|uniref:Uncharacterized protein n=1 Tax=Etheostoma spectabile TaxID=54343 RepID=A0A5J5CT39_9PERO|nr:hypothetical protein FQN60_007944 [Etheostoma spectabile]
MPENTLTHLTASGIHPQREAWWWITEVFGGCDPL